MKGKILIIAISISVCCSTPKTSAELTKEGRKKLYSIESEQRLNQAIQLDSNNHEAYYLLGDNHRMKYMLQRNEIDFDSAVICFLKAINIGSSMNSLYYFMLGEIYQYRGAMKEKSGIYDIDASYLNSAISVYSKSISTDSSNGQVYYSRARCYHFLGDSASDRRDLTKACSIGHHMSCLVLNIEKK